MISQKELAAGVAGIVGGVYHLLTGFFDPTFLMDVSLWYPVVNVFSRDLGPLVMPEIPWNLVGLIATMAFLAAYLYRIDREEESQS